jgi:hypothetical protein
MTLREHMAVVGQMNAAWLVYQNAPPYYTARVQAFRDKLARELWETAVLSERYMQQRARVQRIVKKVGSHHE